MAKSQNKKKSRIRKGVIGNTSGLSVNYHVIGRNEVKYDK